MATKWFFISITILSSNILWGWAGSINDDFLNCSFDDLSLLTQSRVELYGFNAVAGTIPEDILELIDFIKNRQAYLKMGVELPRGILLVGPPGTGKTTLVKAIVQEAGIPYIYKNATEFGSKWIGESAQNIREFFRQGRELAKSTGLAILFMDEVDAFGLRSSDLHHDSREKLNELLAQMDGFERDSSIIVIGATNSPADLDPAFLRPGRFDLIIEIGLPSLKDREAVLKLHAQRTLYDKDDVKFNEIALITDGWSQAELRLLVNESAKLAVRQKADSIKQKHFLDAVEIIKKRKEVSTQKIGGSIKVNNKIKKK